MLNRPLRVDPRSGVLHGARYLPSPNCDARETAQVDVLVVHAISLPPNQFGGSEVEQFFRNQLDHSAHPYFETLRDKRVSAHFYIRRDGEIVQFVPVGRRAWHAGESCWKGRSCVNNFSVGVELEGSDDTPFTDRQYEALAELTVAICGHYRGITLGNVCGHSDVAPGRKTDPGPYFDWPRYRDLCRKGGLADDDG